MSRPALDPVADSAKRLQKGPSNCCHWSERLSTVAQAFGSRARWDQAGGGRVPGSGSEMVLVISHGGMDDGAEPPPPSMSAGWRPAGLAMLPPAVSPIDKGEIHNASGHENQQRRSRRKEERIDRYTGNAQRGIHNLGWCASEF